VADTPKSAPAFTFPAGQRDLPRSSKGEGHVSQRMRPPDTRIQGDQARRVPSNVSNVASERSSGDFYSLSNHSQETLISEQPSIMSERPIIGSAMLRQPYGLKARPPPRIQAVKLMMGYAQVNATFTLDASLVNQSPFEDIKMKGFLGGQAGGGVVGTRRAKRTSGLFGGFSLDSIGESLSGMLGGDNMSSVKEMKATVSSRAVPLLSTPQSLLFVDLDMQPGDERSYSFTYIMPRGLPSSYRGKAIRINYNLTIGVQGTPGSRDVQAVRQISFPIRVFSGVNQDGEILGHDLMQPHVVLQDRAKTKAIDPAEVGDIIPNSTSPASVDASKTEFLQYVETLLDRNRRRQSSTMTLDPRFSSIDAADGTAAMHAINRAIMFSNQSLTAGDASTNRFEIAREGQHVAVVVIDRPLHRLGETITATVDFSEAQVKCASLSATLETTEKVGISLAVRSAATINRVTKRVYAAHSENTLFAQRVVFSPSIPTNATPTFLTSEINLDWAINIQFGTVSSVAQDNDADDNTPALLEEVMKDERGTISVATENLECDTFEVAIPITVYGDIINDGREGNETVEKPI